MSAPYLQFKREARLSAHGLANGQSPHIAEAVLAKPQSVQRLVYLESLGDGGRAATRVSSSTARPRRATSDLALVCCVLYPPPPRVADFVPHLPTVSVELRLQCIWTREL